MRPLPSVQTGCVRVRAIDDDTLVHADGRPRAMFSLEPQNTQLASPAELEMWVEQLAAFVRGLEFPIQLVYRLVPADLDTPAHHVERTADQRGGRLAAIGREHAAFLRHLARTREPLEPRLYVVVGLEGARGSLLEQVAGWLRHLGRRQPNDIPGAERDDTQLLDDRAAQLAVAKPEEVAERERFEHQERRPSPPSPPTRPSCTSPLADVARRPGRILPC
jgi:hypothetical protein